MPTPHVIGEAIDGLNG